MTRLTWVTCPVFASEPLPQSNLVWVRGRRGGRGEGKDVSAQMPGPIAARPWLL